MYGHPEPQQRGLDTRGDARVGRLLRHPGTGQNAGTGRRSPLRELLHRTRRRPSPAAGQGGAAEGHRQAARGPGNGAASRAAGARRWLMSAAEIDEYLDGLDEPKRSTLSQLRRDILAVVPNAEQCISYGLPGFKVAGKTIAGFAAFKNHLSYLPHSGSVFPEVAGELAGYEKSSGALRFPIDQPLPAHLVAKLVAVRLRQAFPSAGVPGSDAV